MIRKHIPYKFESYPYEVKDPPYPPNLDEQFFKELLFIKNEKTIQSNDPVFCSFSFALTLALSLF